MYIDFHVVVGIWAIRSYGCILCVWHGGKNCMYVTMCFLSFWNFVVAYYDGYGGGVFLGGHSCPMDSYYFGELV